MKMPELSVIRNFSERRSANRGFALIIAFSLMSLIVLLLLSLATLVQVETATSSVNRNIIEARQNALLGLSVAMGQLQKYAGDDQRVTAQSNILFTEPVPGDPTNPSPTQRDTRMSSTRDYWSSKQPYWTGVWDSTLSVNVQFPVWLVSGNESLAHIFSDTYPQDYFTPDAAVTGQTVTIVSNGSTSVSNPADFPYRFDPVVNVPLIDIEAIDGTTTGRYAYWVGDAGVKSSIGYRDQRAEIAEDSNDYAKRLAVPHQHTVSILEDFAAASSPDEDLNAVDLFSIEDIPLALQLPAGVPSPDKPGFHDYTAVAATVLSDTKRGGLRFDLYPYLESNVTINGELSDTTSIIDPEDYTDSGDLFEGNTGFPNSLDGLPRWGHVRNWYNLGNGNAALNVSAPTQSSAGVYPVIGGFRLHAGFSFFNSAEGTRLRFRLLPQISLWNPYDKPLAAEKYTLRLKMKIAPSRITVVSSEGDLNEDGEAKGPGDAAPFWHSYSVTDISTGSVIMATVPNVPMAAWRMPDATDDFIWTFIIECPDMEAGESLAFFPEANESYSGNNRLVNAYASNDPFTIYLDSPFTIEPAIPDTLPAGDARINAEFRLIHPRYSPWDIDFEAFPSTDYVEMTLLTATLTELLSMNQLTADYGGATQSFRLGSHVGGNVDKADSKQNEFNLDTNRWRYLYSDDLIPGTSFDNDDKESFYFGLPPAGYIADINPREVDLGGRQNISDIKVQKSLRLFANYNPTASDWTLNPVDATMLHRPDAADMLPDRLHQFSNENFSTSFNLANDFSWTQPEGDRPTLAMIDRRRAQRANPLSPRFPVKFTPRDDTPMYSLGALQFAPLSNTVDQPMYAFGNSEAPIYTRRDRLSGFESDRITINNNSENRQVDLSYLLNDALWDKYFISGLPRAGDLADFRDGTSVENPALVFTGDEAVADDALRAPETAAEHLMVKGSFNVNSTSVEAWKSVLGAYWGLKDGAVGGKNPDSTVPISLREEYFAPALQYEFDINSSEPSTFGGTSNSDYLGFFGGSRYLNEEQIDALAERIVDEVRARGPFLSMADFVNRRLVAPDDFNKTNVGYDPFVGLQGLNGALQRAINLSGINGGDNARFELADDLVFSVGQAPVNNRNIIYPNSNYHYLDAEHRAGVPAGTPHSGAIAGVSETGQLFAHTPGFLTQADLLTVLSPILSPRSDTFVIRAYGESPNSFTGDAQARAWCEAVVQRMPEELTPGSNERGFELISFKWLNEDEI